MKPANDKLVESATAAAASTENWADLSNILFNAETGLITKAFPTTAERAEFMQTPEYQAIRALLKEQMEQTGLAAGGTPEKSGRFVVRLPKSLHAALEREANQEGVSLNQLVVAKLAVQLGQAVTKADAV